MTNKMSDREFGVEIEFCTHADVDWWENKLRSETGIEVAAYGDFSDGWILTDDGSVDGWELVSPILSGDDGLKQVSKMLAAIKNLGGWMDNTCGFHVHVNANDFSNKNILSAVKKYNRNEKRIDKYVSPSRNSNQYCKSTTRLLEEINEEIDISSIGELYWDWFDRYYKLNVAAYAKHGTLEFRQHEGSFDIAKVTNWIKFCVRFVEDVKTNGRFKGPAQATRQNSRSFPVIAKLLMHGGGKTSKKKIATALKVSENSVSKYMSLFRRRTGVNIKSENGNYFALGMPPRAFQRTMEQFV